MCSWLAVLLTTEDLNVMKYEWFFLWFAVCFYLYIHFSKFIQIFLTLYVVWSNRFIILYWKTYYVVKCYKIICVTVCNKNLICFFFSDLQLDITKQCLRPNIHLDKTNICFEHIFRKLWIKKLICPIIDRIYYDLIDICMRR